MNESSKEWRKKYNVTFFPNKPEDGPGGYFTGFDGRKTNYMGLTPEEKANWIKQGQENPDFQESIDRLIKNNTETGYEKKI